MICSSVNLFFTSNLLSSGLDSRVRRYSNPGDVAWCMSLLWFQRNPLPTDWVAQREVVVAFDS